jgi:dihydrodipicolinate synthase/N-acetylneuraminate lyase
LSQYAEKAGAQGVVHTLPEAILPQGNETYADVILRYFETINNAVNCPIFIYQPPGTAAEYILRSPLIEKLADLPNVKGMKASTPDAMYILDVGHEGAFYAGLHSGAKAVIGQGSTLNPQILLAVQERFEAGDMDGAFEAQYSVNYLCQNVGNPVEFYKRYACSKGFEVKTNERVMKNLYGTPRPALSKEEFEKSARTLEAELAKYTTTSVA